MCRSRTFRAVPAFMAALLAYPGCGLLGGVSPPDGLPLDLPGPFGEAGRLDLCMGGTRVDAPAAAGPDGTGGIIGFCVPGERTALACARDVECGARERCVCGWCRVPACRVSADCPEGQDCTGHGHRCQQRCLDDEDCPPGESCDPTTLGCSTSCTLDVECSFGEVCSTTRRVCVSVECGEAGCSAGRRCDVQRRTITASRPAILVGPDPVMWLGIEGVGVVRFAGQGWGDWTGQSTPDIAPQLRDPAVTGSLDGGLLLAAGQEDGQALVALVTVAGGAWSPLSGSGVILVPEQEWEGGWIGRPGVVQDGDGWLVAYEGGPGAGIGLARLDDTGACARLSPGPVLGPADAGTEPHWMDITALGSPFLFIQDCGPGWSGTGLLFEATGLERIDLEVEGGDPPAPNASVGYARLDRDGSLVVDPMNPLYTTMAGLAVTRSERTPAVVCDDGLWVLVYEAADPLTGQSEGLFWALPY